MAPVLELNTKITNLQADIQSARPQPARRTSRAGTLAAPVIDPLNAETTAVMVAIVATVGRLVVATVAAETAATEETVEAIVVGMAVTATDVLMMVATAAILETRIVREIAAMIAETIVAADTVAIVATTTADETTLIAVVVMMIGTEDRPPKIKRAFFLNFAGPVPRGGGGLWVEVRHAISSASRITWRFALLLSFMDL